MIPSNQNTNKARELNPVIHVNKEAEHLVIRHPDIEQIAPPVAPS